jgi:hypothetical protein
MNSFLNWGSWLLVSMGSMWPVASLAGDQGATDCRLRQLASIDLQIGSAVLIPVTVDGTSASMTLNSGLPTSIIYQQVATEMKLAIVQAPAPYANFPGMVRINSMSLGSFDAGKIQLLVVSHGPMPTPGLPTSIGSIAIPAGILPRPGARFRMDFELDFAHKKLNLFSTTHCPGKVVYWADKAAAIPYTIDKLGTAVFPIELDGKKISSALQVGSPSTLIHVDASKAFYGFDEHSEGIRHDTSNSGKTVNHYRAMQMTLPGLSVLNADVKLVPGLAKCWVSPNWGPEHSATYGNCYGNPPLTLGGDVLQHLRLYFATEEHVLYVTAADATLPTESDESNERLRIVVTPAQTEH